MKLFYGFTREFLLSLFSYNPETGVVTSRIARGRHGRHKAGRVVGYVEANGYVRVNIEGTMVRLHQLIWFMQTGETPQHVDHKNLNKNDHTWTNLRAASASENHGNMALKAVNKSGFKGVSFDSRTGKWRASIGASSIKKKSERLDDKRHAAAIYNYWALEYFGEFARLNDIPGVGMLAVPLDSIGLYL